MKKQPLPWVFAGIAWFVLVSVTGANEPTGTALFESKIRPVLVESCVKCHGEKKSKGNLRLDSRAALLQGGDSGPAVLPGDPQRSLLIQSIRHSHAEIKMPPDRKLSAAVIDDFVTWIKDGAAWTGPGSAAPMNLARHWSFEPIRNP